MTAIYNPNATKDAPLASMTVLEINANHEGETHTFFQSLRDSIEESGHDGSDYARDNGAYHIVHASDDMQMTMEEKTFPEKSLDQGLRRFAQAMADHAVVFELVYPDGFRCRLQFV